MRLVFWATFILSYILLGCTMSHSDKFVSAQSGAELKVTLNAGPIVNTVTLHLSLLKASGFKAGMPVNFIAPEKEIKAYLKEQNNNFEINVGNAKKLTIDAPKTFYVSVQPAKQGKHLYLLDNKASLSINIPYIVLQKVQFVIIVNNAEIVVPTPIDKRSTAQVNVDDLNYIIRVNNPPGEPSGESPAGRP